MFHRLFGQVDPSKFVYLKIHFISLNNLQGGLKMYQTKVYILFWGNFDEKGYGKLTIFNVYISFHFKY